MDKKKVIATTVATVTAASLLLGGTFAWYNAQNAVNEFTGDIVSGSVLHDDFKAPDKDVYVENTGTSALFVRVRLDEYLETIEKNQATGTSIIDGAKRKEKDTWLTHKYTGETAANDGVEFHKYYKWTMGGPETEYKPAAVNSSGVVGKYPTYDSTQISQVGDKATSQFTGDGFVAGADGNLKTPESDVVTMEAYAAKSTTDKEAFVGWILDTDGWAYWHEKLASGTATGLLLSQVDNVATPETGDSYYYAINAVMQTVTESDIEAWTEGAQANLGSTDQVSTPGRGTDAAAKFLKSISSSYVLITDDMSRKIDPDGYVLNASDFNTDGDEYFSEEEYKAYKAALEAAEKKYYVEQLTDAEVGGVVKMDGTEWIVLSKDASSESAVVMSRTSQITSVWTTSATSKISYADSVVRDELNGSYYDSLGKVYKSMIVPTDIKYIPTTNMTTVKVSSIANVSEYEATNMTSILAAQNVYLPSMGEIYTALNDKGDFASLVGEGAFSGTGGNPGWPEWITRTSYLAKEGNTGYNYFGFKVDTSRQTGAIYGGPCQHYRYMIRPAMTVSYKADPVAEIAE